MQTRVLMERVWILLELIRVTVTLALPDTTAVKVFLLCFLYIPTKYC